MTDRHASPFIRSLFGMVFVGRAIFYLILNTAVLTGGARQALIPIAVNIALLAGYFIRPQWFPAAIKAFSVFLVMGSVAAWILIANGRDYDVSKLVIRNADAVLAVFFFLYADSVLKHRGRGAN